MQKMELMLKMTDKENVKSYVLPLIFKGLESINGEIQVLMLFFFFFARFLKTLNREI